MEKVIKSEKLPIKLWLKNIDSKALEQAKNLANLPFAFHHIAIMPDAHEGYGMPIGGVLAAKKVIVPNAVGVDIGCGMCAAQTTLKSVSQDDLKKILEKIRAAIPTGFSHHRKEQEKGALPEKKESMPIINSQFKRALKQVGTLGGGNHFIEIQKGSDGYIWIMTHSGSRNIGKRVADYYNKLAIGGRKKWKSEIPIKWQLDFLPADSEEGVKYLAEMKYCVNFALANRKLMMEKIAEILEEVAPGRLLLEKMANIAHNYASSEKHFGENVWIHRKGATQAREGQIGIIPGSQGSRSYITRGLGNPDSFESCSHGAGRKLGRNQARRTLDLEKEKEWLNKKGVLHAIRGKMDLDEAPGAYKDIDEIMELQKDLVDVVVELAPLAVVKG